MKLFDVQVMCVENMIYQAISDGYSIFQVLNDENIVYWVMSYEDTMY